MKTTFCLIEKVLLKQTEVHVLKRISIPFTNNSHHHHTNGELLRGIPVKINTKQKCLTMTVIIQYSLDVLFNILRYKT